MYIVYVIKSKIKSYTYMGMTNNLTRRLFDHNMGYNKTTKAYHPFDLVYTEECSDRVSARKREKYLKSGIGREFIKSLLK